MFELTLILSALLAGLLTFLAPCTFPLVPAYLSFISGGSTDRKKIFLNGLGYVIGFSVVFIVLGSLAGLVGGYVVKYQNFLASVGGVFVIAFGMLMISQAMHWEVPGTGFLSRPHSYIGLQHLSPSHPLSALIFGAAFALGWTPCVGPVLGAILTLAATRATVVEGAFLLTIFSIGLGLPFLVMALGVGYVVPHLRQAEKLFVVISLIGGSLLILLGILLLTQRLGIWMSWFFRITSVFGYDRLLYYF